MSQDIASTPQPTSAGTIIKRMQEIISFIVGLGALLSGTGFLIVHTYLATYSDLQSYNIPLVHYLAAGIGLVVLIPFIVIGIGVTLLSAIQRANNSIDSMRNAPGAKSLSEHNNNPFLAWLLQSDFELS